ncbi:MAG: isoprenylcysteine carboxylmethyltransferase family protein [Peptococcaceae bacterium]|nr:isoprenylcysteine carboxylmethyltransferase family protein [Peptococcaceae bacterium]
MGDPSKFSSLIEYQIAYYAIVLLILSEIVIWIFSSRGKGKEKRQFADRGTIWLIIICWCFGIMAGALFRSQSAPEFVRSWLLPHFFYYVGVVFIILGIVIRCTAVLTLKKAFTLHVQTTNDQHLIKTGLYHFVRNPAYTGSIISLLGVALSFRSIPGAILVIIISLICYSIRIHIEETALFNQFHDEFECYCKETKYRLIPRIY